MSEAIKLRLAQPDIGPSGILIPMPDQIHPITMGDVFEVLRWVHGDLKRIHQAFGSVEGVRREMTTIKVIHKRQNADYLAMLNRHSELVRMAEAQTQCILDQAQEIAEQRKSLETMQESLALIQSEVSKPWWRKIYGGK